jgi:hypothetical protein
MYALFKQKGKRIHSLAVIATPICGLSLKRGWGKKHSFPPQSPFFIVIMIVEEAQSL